MRRRTEPVPVPAPAKTTCIEGGGSGPVLRICLLSLAILLPTRDTAGRVSLSFSLLPLPSFRATLSFPVTRNRAQRNVTSPLMRFARLAFFLSRAAMLNALPASPVCACVRIPDAKCVRVSHRARDVAATQKLFPACANLLPTGKHACT